MSWNANSLDLIDGFHDLERQIRARRQDIIGKPDLGPNHVSAGCDNAGLDPEHGG